MKTYLKVILGSLVFFSLVLWLLSVDKSDNGKNANNDKQGFYERNNLSEKGKTNAYVAKSILPSEYVKMLGVGLDVDWLKTTKVRRQYSGELPDIFKKRGFGHVRLRVKDEIDEKLLKDMEAVVQDCLEADLIPILAYQANDFKINPNKKTMRDVVSWWERVAEHFKKYSLELTFDFLIETTDELNNNPELLNELYGQIIRVVRESGGNNQQRIVFASPVKRSDPQNLRLLKIPDGDQFIMGEWHFYASGPDKNKASKLWTVGNVRERQIIRDKISVAKRWEKKTGHLTWVGAWMPGNYNKGNDYSVDEQIVFARFVSCELKKNKIPFAVNSGHHFFDYNQQRWIVNRNRILESILNPECQERQEG